MRDIRIAVVEQLNAFCAECDNTIIDRQSFACFPDTPTYITYRARLQGTSDTNSSLLITLIEEWVRNGTKIVVTGILMDVDAECSVSILSISEGECSLTQIPVNDPTQGNMGTINTIDYRSPSTSSGSSTNIDIIGGVLAASIVTILIIAVVIIGGIVLKYHHRRLAVKTTEM